jgi:hypothetical protein
VQASGNRLIKLATESLLSFNLIDLNYIIGMVAVLLAFLFPFLFLLP